MKYQMLLKDGNIIDIEDASITQHFVVNCKAKSDFLEIWDRLNDDNLSEVQILKDGSTALIITGLKLYGVQTMNNDDGTITGHFYCEGGEVQANTIIADDTIS